MTEHIKIERKDGILTLTFARPDKKNALTNAMYGVMADSLVSAETDPAARVIAFESFEPGLALYLGRPVPLLSDTGGELTSNYVRAQHGRLTPSATLRPVAALSTLLRDPAPLYVVTAPARLRNLRRFGGRLIVLYADRRSVLLAAGAARADQIRSDGGQHRSGAS